MSHIVFISHAKENKDIADVICKSLENEEIKCWIAFRDILPSESYPGAIVSAIKTTRMVLVILSKYSNRSKHVIKELERAFDLEKPILPLRIEDVKLSDDMEYLISSTHYLDALASPIKSHIPKLVESIKSIVNTIKLKPNVVDTLKPVIPVFTEEKPIKRSKRGKLRIFITYALNDYKSYRIREIARYLVSKKEISYVYSVTEDFIGNIDDWINKTVPRCQILIFFATDNSLTSKICLTELRLTSRYNIQIIPILGVNISWEDLISNFADLDISRKLGLIYDPMDINKLCKDLYRYILIYKLDL